MRISQSLSACSAVILREGGGSSTPRIFVSVTDVVDYRPKLTARLIATDAEATLDMAYFDPPA
jgi:hypothetical protein